MHKWTKQTQAHYPDIQLKQLYKQQHCCKKSFNYTNIPLHKIKCTTPTYAANHNHTAAATNVAKKDKQLLCFTYELFRFVFICLELPLK